MKKKVLLRVLAVVLVFSLLPVNASAVEINGWNMRKTSGGWLENIILSLWDRITGDGAQSGEETPEGTGSDLTLVTDSTTVENGDMLRASTYELTSGNAAAASTETTLKYFPVTFYDYEKDVINAATHEAELAAGTPTVWNGIYFSTGSPEARSYTKVTPVSHTDLTWAQVQSGTYYADETCTTKAEVKAVQSATAATVTCNTLISSNSNNSWKSCSSYYYLVNGVYYPLYAKRSSNNWGTTYYNYTWGYGSSSSNVTQITTQQTTSTRTNANITVYKDVTTTGYTLVAGSQTLANLSGTDTSAKVGVTLYTIGSSTTTKSLTFADWNWWNKNSGANINGQKFYTGLVQSTLDANKDIVFNKPDGGIFNSDSTVKSIYTNVEMPFVYENGTYTFDAAENGVYFHEDSTQKSSGTAASNSRLYFHDGTPQTNSFKAGDGSETEWLPFNDGTTINFDDTNYYFGMRTTIPFTMTPNGRLNANEDTSEAVQFSFSGDDDVWVFIDGKLVIDLGGIHNRLDATIDFAANTVTYEANNSTKLNTGSYNDTSFSLTQTLFDTEGENGLISQDRESFAAATEHELTIFYLERGAGSSNCKIQFNLPMKDTLTVTKQISRSYSKDENEQETYSQLTKSEQETVNGIHFGFTLYKSTDGKTFETVKDQNYSLLNSSGQLVSTPSTDSYGHFYLQNGQSARFYGNVDEGVWYYVLEDSLKDGFVTPDYTFSGTAAGGFDTDVDGDGVTEHYSSADAIALQEVALDATENKSRVIKITGSEESADNLTFVCENFLDAKIPNPSNYPNNDRIVLDYGLAVEIDVLKNDLWRGDTQELVTTVYGDGLEIDETTGEITTAAAELKFGTAEVVGDKIIYRLNKQMTDVEVLNYVVKVTGSEKNNVTGSVETAYRYAVGTAYIIPATVMYYEENFGDLVTYTGSGWQKDLVSEPQYTVEYQEPGVVGTVDDSPYGSDVAYQHDSHDSNGTSKYADTTNGAVKFEYTFTGTGTSFFARTSNNTGYMKVTLTKAGTNDRIDGVYRDTYYESATDVTLYNVPVVTFDELEYGTYTVTVIVAKASQTSSGTIRYHSDFWLDGIRVFNPMDTTETGTSRYKDVALSSYAADGEANMTNVTVRDKLISDSIVNEDGTYSWKEGEGFVVFTDTNGAIETVEEYRSNGPKEEVYLNDGQSISFSLKNWNKDTHKIYLGLKAPMGSATVKIGSVSKTLDNAADCYFDISNYAVITTQQIDGEDVKVATFTIQSVESLVSATNIKVTGSAEFTIIEGKNVDVGGNENMADEVQPEEER